MTDATNFDAEVQVTTTVNWRDHLGRFASAVEHEVEEAVQEAADRGADLSRAFAPEDTGAMAATIHSFIDHSGKAGWTVGTKAALPQEHGARAHVIQSHSGGPLANKRKKFFAKSGRVNHPGNPATHFMVAAYDIVKSDLKQALRMLRS